MISWPVARAAAGEKLRSPPVVAISLCFAAVGALRGGPEGGAETFGSFGRVFFTLLTLALGAGLLSDELDTGHAQLVLLRPLTRASWVGGRLAGAGLALAFAVALAWAATAAAAAARGHAFSASRLLALPLAVLWGLAWLSVLACLGAVLPGWTNSGAVVLLGVSWLFVQVTLPLVMKRPEWAGPLVAVGSYLGPQEPLPPAPGVQPGLGPVLYDLTWTFTPWLAAVLLFNRRELARRRT